MTDQPVEGSVRFDAQSGRDRHGERVAVIRQVLQWVPTGEVAVFRGKEAAEQAARFIAHEVAS